MPISNYLNKDIICCDLILQSLRAGLARKLCRKVTLRPVDIEIIGHLADDDGGEVVYTYHHLKFVGKIMGEQITHDRSMAIVGFGQEKG